MTHVDPLCALIDDLLSILGVGEHDVTWSRYQTVEEAIADLKRLRDRISAGDPAAREQFKVLCLPTASIDEIAISSGWAGTWLKLVDGKYRSAFT